MTVDELKAAYAERDKVFAPMNNAQRARFQEARAAVQRRLEGDSTAAKYYLCDLGKDAQGRMVMDTLNQAEFDAWINGGQMPDRIPSPPRLVGVV